jgi:hypothetical protein|tara:strand:- start:408 stop:1154 length:747 start_codon:yes stop_codon:yes gene_type:complete
VKTNIVLGVLIALAISTPYRIVQRTAAEASATTSESSPTAAPTTAEASPTAAPTTAEASPTSADASRTTTQQQGSARIRIAKPTDPVDIAVNKPTGPALASRAATGKARRRQIWTQTDSARLTHPADRGLPNSKPVRIDRSEFRELQVGDTIELNIPQLSTRYAAEVDDIVEHGNGDLSWRGHLSDYEDPYAVIVTMGSSANFATIATPEGAFLLEAAESSGVMIALADLEVLIDTNVQDYQIPAIQR